jgi:solute carrier family 25 folate transporter 32
MLSGMLSGLACCFAFYAFESTEARMQVFQGAKGNGAVVRPTMSGTLQQVVRSEGLRGLYRGVVPTALGASVNWGVFFSLYHACRTTVARIRNPQLASTDWVPANLSQDLFAASVSGAVCCVLVNPFWVLKLRMITSGSPSEPNSNPNSTRARPPSMVEALRSILRNEGPTALWKGLTPSLVGVSEGALQFMTYDQMKLLFRTMGDFGVKEQLLAGGLSKVVSVLATYPYQLIRSALQQNNSPYNGIVDAAQTIYRLEGLRGLYKGMGVNLMRQVPPSAVMFYFVEQLRIQLSRVFGEESGKSL